VKTTLLARDVTKEIGDLAAGQRVGISAGVAALCEHADEARRERAMIALVKKILLDPTLERHSLPETTGVRLVRGGGRSFFLLDGMELPDGKRPLAIVTLSEIELAGGFDIALDVRERVRPAIVN
jgi:hypothetical protein